MRLALFIPSLLSLQLVVGAAHAQQDDPRKKQAEAPFQEGLKLHDQGREAAAFEKFREAYALYPSPNLLFQIARSEEILGRPVEAIQHYHEAMQSPLLHPKNRALGEAYVAALEKRLARLDVRGPAGLVVKVLDKEQRLPLEAPLFIEPVGPIVASGALGDERYEGRATTSAGATSLLEMKSVAPAASAGANGPQAPSPLGAMPPAEPPASGEFFGWRSIVGLSLVGVGAAALTASFVFGSNASDHDDRARSLGASLPPGTGACSSATPAPPCAELSRALEARNDARSAEETALPLGIAALGVGAGLIVSSVVWPHGPSRSAMRLTPAIGPRVAAASWQISF